MKVLFCTCVFVYDQKNDAGIKTRSRNRSNFPLNFNFSIFDSNNDFEQVTNLVLLYTFNLEVISKASHRKA